MRHRYSQKILPKIQDTDTEVRYIKDGAARYILNGRIGKRDESTKGAFTNIKGTLFVPNNLLPNGENTCLGTRKNNSGSFIIFFNWNSNNESGIYIYNPTFDNPIQLLIKDTPDNVILGFHKHFKIAGAKAKILMDKYLYWTDRYNSPRFLNIDWAIDYKKQKKWEIQQVDNDILNFNILNFKHNGVSVSLFTGNNGTLLASNQLISEYFEVENCDCSIILKEKISGSCDISTSSPQLRIVAQNFYPKPHNERQIDLVCYPPSTAPRVVLKRDRKNKRNLLSGNTWQFRYKYIYKDGNSSVWSSWSKSINTSGDCAKKYNYIEIDYTDEIFDCLNDSNQLHLIDKVMLGYRNTNNGELYSFITIDQCQIPKGQQAYRFYNDIFASAVGEYDDLKQYDTVPLQCGVLSSSNNRLLLGDCTENYHEECFDFDLDVQFNPNEKSKTYNGSAKVEIRIKSFVNGDYLMPIMQLQEESNVYYWGGVSINNPAPAGRVPITATKEALDNFGQKLAMKGFIGYIAGTDIMSISTQSNTTLRKIDKSNIIKLVDGTSDFDSLVTLLDDNKNTFVQELSFDGLADGKYIIRLASHWCWQNNDVLGKGDAYNIDNGLAYQKTSTNVYSVNGDINAREVVVEIVNGVQVGSVPYFEVEDTARSADVVTSLDEEITLIQGYLIDERSSNQADIYNGIRVERATVGMYALTPVTEHETDGKYFTYTDHNGYFYGRFEANSVIENKIKILATKNRDRNWNVLSGFIGEPSFVWNNDTVLKGNLSELKQETCSIETNNSYAITSGIAHNFVLYSVRPNAENISSFYRTQIKGRVVDSDGFGVSDLIVVASQTGRTDKTDADGNFSIVLYGNYANNMADQRDVTLYIFGNSCINGFTHKEYTFKMGQSFYNNTTHYNVGDIVLLFVDNELTSTYYLKNGGTYDFGITLMDRALRKTTVISNESKHRLRLPFSTEPIQDYFPNITTDTLGNPITPTTKADGYFTVKVKTKTAPPIWSTHLYILRTEDQVYSDYIQMIISDVKYVVNYAEKTVDGVIVPDTVYTTYSAADANEIYLDIVTSFVQYKDRNSDSVKGWTFEKGDRLRFLYKKDGTLHDFVEVEIKEQRGNYFVIPLIESLGEIFQGEVVEIFRLKTITNKKNFYETSEFIKINNPYKPTRSYNNTEIALNTGDAYRRRRKMYAKNEDTYLTHTRIIEDTTPNDTYIIKDNDKGRVDFINDFNKQIRRIAIIRFGGNILLDSNINTIRQFNAEQEVSGDNDKGVITIIDDFTNLIFVAQETKCHTRLVGKTTAYLGDGGVSHFRTNDFLDIKPYYLDIDGGCKNPESYIRLNNAGIFFDAISGVVLKYSPQNGLSNISGFDNRYENSRLQESVFKPLLKQLSEIPNDIYNYVCSVVSGFSDQTNNEVNISIQPINITIGQSLSSFNGYGLNSNIGENDVKFKQFGNADFQLKIEPFTNCYDIDTGFWIGFRSYIPEMYGSLKNDYIAFINGQLHLMEKGSKYSNFFDVQYKSALDVVMNTAPSDMKVFTNWSVESNKKWSNPYVKVANSRSFRSIESRTPDSMIILQNGAFYAPFMFDTNTPNVSNPLMEGNPLVGETLLLRLENNNEEEVILFAINIYAGYSGRTNF